jgi:hypothetical protein
MRNGNIAARHPSHPAHALAIVSLVVLLGGGAAGGHLGHGLVLLLVGSLVVWRPPTRAPSLTLNLALTGLIGWALLQCLPFLPGGGFWRPPALAVDLPLAPSVAAQPMLALEGVAVLVAGVAWLLLMCSLPVNPERRQAMLAAFAGFAAVVAAAVYAGTALDLVHPLAPRAEIFSFFPNRNQTAILIATGGVAAFGLAFERIQRQPAHGLGWLALTLVCCLGLIAAQSRAAVAFFLVGCAIWSVYSLRREGGRARWKLLLPAFAWLATILFFTGGATSGRLLRLVGLEENLGADYRVLFYADTARLLADVPLSGVGTGHFRDVFPQYRRAVGGSDVALHPESDWLWALAEWGLVGGLLLALGVVGMVRGTKPEAGHRVDRFRRLAGLCTLVLAAHSLVDVSMHRWGTFLAAAFLYGLSHTSVRRELPPLWLPGAVWRILGLALALLGVAWLAAPVHRLPVSRDAVRAAAERWTAASRAAPADGALAARAAHATGRYQEALPLQWEAAFLRGQAALAAGDLAAAVSHFGQAQFLQPRNQRILTAIGDRLLTPHPAAALGYYRAALTTASDPGRDRQAFMDIMARVAREPRAAQGLERLSRLRPMFRVIYLWHLDNARFPEQMARDLAAAQPLAGWPEAEACRLARRQVRLGHAADVLRAGARDAAFAERCWAAHALALARTGAAAEAHAILRARLPEPSVPEYGADHTPAFLRGLLRYNPDDFAAAAALVRRYIDAGQSAEALAVIEAVRDWRAAPPAFLYWRAQLLWETDRRDEAWVFWDRYLDALEQP